jgi:hypothetical protein
MSDFLSAIDQIGIVWTFGAIVVGLVGGAVSRGIFSRREKQQVFSKLESLQQQIVVLAGMDIGPDQKQAIIRGDVDEIRVLTQQEYDSLQTKDPRTLYLTR